jgi:hypothetical protein
MRKGVETGLDASTLVVRIPMHFQRRGGRKCIVVHDGADEQATAGRTPVKALATDAGKHRVRDGG